MDVIVWLENLKGGDHSEDLDLDDGIILKWILWKQVGRCGFDGYGSG
jgi:hypothetical protein